MAAGGQPAPAPYPGVEARPGGAPVLLLSNSLGTDLGMWDTQIPALTAHFRVLRY
ncbi:hypothetical protein AB3459_34265, partial [Pseudomonas aeruginosa]